MSWLRNAAGALTAAASTAGVLAARKHLPGAAKFDRTNHKGEQVTLLEGPAYTTGAIAGIAIGDVESPHVRAAALLATVGAGAFGAVDDLAERGSSKGLRGHIGALVRGELTTGALKVLGISAAGIASAALVLDKDPKTSVAGHLADIVVAGGVVAGSANLFNLLDLRPGRALKAAIGTGALQAGYAGLKGGDPNAGLLSATAGAIAGSWKSDLSSRSMLGDSGANAAGALLGVHTICTAPRWVRAAALAGIVGLTLASEKVSFTKVIESTPVLRDVDAWGRGVPRHSAGS
ncbi:hypothetical protein LWF01_05285 [Saxibacter everestensis]|uniref:UDP-N-acetylmuramyl pentapeptide phosphotransferase/UDP-N-acetylglucosamine-1-phosphate transferase n=1 Tax=Saxibacter everestensis TaxID=2909229 RepID=A0ABY8QXR3_9MICO|nr:hypothetical protein LWF01_05285 [Brevibacteriaceae bacterium ZFBP1038]